MLEIEMAVFAFVTSASPGPVNILAFVSGVNFNFKSSLSFVLGATIGFCSILIVTGFGIGQILRSNIVLSVSLTIAGSMYMLFLALKLARARIDVNQQKIEEHDAPRFRQGAFLQFINPKAWFVSMSGASMYLQGEHYQVQLVLFVIIFFIVCFASISTWVYLGCLMSKKMGARSLTIYNKGVASLLVVLVTYNLYSTLLPLFTD